MRATLLLVALAGGCVLGGGHSGDDYEPPVMPDAPPPPDPCASPIAQCADGAVTLSPPMSASCPQFDPTVVVHECATECTTDYLVLCRSPGCNVVEPSELCDEFQITSVPPLLECAETTDPSCPVDGTEPCGGQDACNGALVTGSCTCAAGVQTCEAACADGLCSAGAVQAALVGTWTASVSTSWGDAYSGTITIEPDGHYATVLPGYRSVFYYSVDGAGAGRRFDVVGQTALGATAIVRLFGGPDTSGLDMLIRYLRVVDADHVTFDGFRAWAECERYAQFDLVRAP